MLMLHIVTMQVELLLRVHHINLVNLVGYCDERDHLALIYEYMPNGDLKEHLLGGTYTASFQFLNYQKMIHMITDLEDPNIGKRGGSVLSWSTRLRIAVDAALGS